MYFNESELKLEKQLNQKIRKQLNEILKQIDGREALID